MVQQVDDLKDEAIAFRLHRAIGALALIVFGGGSLYLWFLVTGVDGRDDTALTMGLVIGGAMTAFVAFCLVRDAFVARAIALTPTEVVVPRLIAGPPRRIAYGEVRAMGVIKIRRVTYLRVYYGDGKVDIPATWLPRERNVQWLREQIAARIEIATGRRLK